MNIKDDAKKLFEKYWIRDENEMSNSVRDIIMFCDDIMCELYDDFNKEEIIKCKNCIYSYEQKPDEIEPIYHFLCNHPNGYFSTDQLEVSHDGFCSWGVKK